MGHLQAQFRSLNINLKVGFLSNCYLSILQTSVGFQNRGKIKNALSLCHRHSQKLRWPRCRRRSGMVRPWHPCSWPWRMSSPRAEGEDFGIVCCGKWGKITFLGQNLWFSMLTWHHGASKRCFVFSMSLYMFPQPLSPSAVCGRTRADISVFSLCNRRLVFPFSRTRTKSR